MRLISIANNKCKVKYNDGTIAYLTRREYEEEKARITAQPSLPFEASDTPADLPEKVVIGEAPGDTGDTENGDPDSIVADEGSSSPSTDTDKEDEE